jgi:alkanesulfonate monooxygenase SsuD/methylene tetrahydromethanopterin reductase-like flavin-dependent oxidoreductase (luciferase family)
MGRLRRAEMTKRAGRYERMEEYMEVCYKLWNSWEPDAIVADRETGIFADPAKVHEVNHVGEFFRCKGRSFVFRSPQGYPVLWQAGSSDRGRDFAAKQ